MIRTLVHVRSAAFDSSVQTLREAALTSPSGSRTSLANFLPARRACALLVGALLLGSSVAEAQIGSSANEFANNDQTGSGKVDGAPQGDPVVMSTGNFALHATDLEIAGRGLDFSFERSYRNGTFDTQLGASLPWSPLGHGWSHNQHHLIVIPWTVAQGPWGNYTGPEDAAEGGNSLPLELRCRCVPWEARAPRE